MATTPTRARAGAGAAASRRPRPPDAARGTRRSESTAKESHHRGSRPGAARPRASARPPRCRSSARARWSPRGTSCRCRRRAAPASRRRARAAGTIGIDHRHIDTNTWTPSDDISPSRCRSALSSATRRARSIRRNRAYPSWTSGCRSSTRFRPRTDRRSGCTRRTIASRLWRDWRNFESCGFSARGIIRSTTSRSSTRSRAGARTSRRYRSSSRRSRGCRSIARTCWRECRG